MSHPILAERAFGSAEPRISGDHRRTDLTSSTPCPLHRSPYQEPDSAGPYPTLTTLFQQGEERLMIHDTPNLRENPLLAEVLFFLSIGCSAVGNDDNTIPLVIGRAGG